MELSGCWILKLDLCLKELTWGSSYGFSVPEFCSLHSFSSMCTSNQLFKGNFLCTSDADPKSGSIVIQDCTTALRDCMAVVPNRLTALPDRITALLDHMASLTGHITSLHGCMTARLDYTTALPDCATTLPNDCISGSLPYQLVPWRSTRLYDCLTRSNNCPTGSYVIPTRLYKNVLNGMTPLIEYAKAVLDQLGIQDSNFLRYYQPRKLELEADDLLWGTLQQEINRKRKKM